MNQDRVRLVRQFENANVGIHYKIYFKSDVDFRTKQNCFSQGSHLTLPMVKKTEAGTQAGTDAGTEAGRSYGWIQIKLYLIDDSRQ